MAIDLPNLENMPVLMDLPLIMTNESGNTRFGTVPVFAFVASLILTITDGSVRTSNWVATQIMQASRCFTCFAAATYS